MACTTTFLSNGCDPLPTDTINTLLKRIAGSASGGGGGGGSGLFTLGVVDPEGVVTAPAGTGYLNTALQTMWIKQSGSGNTGWTPQLI